MGKVKTAIPGLDEFLEESYVENDVILVAGGPGKTAFGMQYSCMGARTFNEPRSACCDGRDFFQDNARYVEIQLGY